VKLTTHLHLAPSSGMLEAVTPLVQYAFMAWCSVWKYYIDMKQKEIKVFYNLQI